MKMRDNKSIEEARKIIGELPSDVKFQLIGDLLRQVNLPALPDSELQHLLSVFPEATSPKNMQEEIANDFERIYTSEFCSLESRELAIGREVRLSIKGSYRSVLNHINAISQERYCCDAICLDYLLKINGIDDRNKDGKIMTFIPVIKESENRIRSGADPGKAHDALLKSLNMDWVEKLPLAAAAGAFRLAKGFAVPDESGDVVDEGDLFQGFVVRARDGAIHTLFSIDDFSYYDGGYADGGIVVAGARR